MRLDRVRGSHHRLPEQVGRVRVEPVAQEARLPQHELRDAVVPAAVVDDEGLPEGQDQDEAGDLVRVEVPREGDLDADPDDDDQGEGRVEVRADRDELVGVGGVEAVDRREDPRERVLRPGGRLGEECRQEGASACPTGGRP